MVDVVVIGAGPVGLACALEAKREGLTACVIEKGTLVNSIVGYPANMEFFSTPYDAAAELGAWPRAQLERSRSEEDEHALFTSEEARQQPAPDGGL